MKSRKRREAGDKGSRIEEEVNNEKAVYDFMWTNLNNNSGQCVKLRKRQEAGDKGSRIEEEVNNEKAVKRKIASSGK